MSPQAWGGVSKAVIATLQKKIVPPLSVVDLPESFIGAKMVLFGRSLGQ
jgi:hypothetical protein